MVTAPFSVPNSSTISVTTTSRYAGSGNKGIALYSYPGTNNIGFRVSGRALPTDPWVTLATGSGSSGFVEFPLVPNIAFSLATPDATDPVDVTFFETAQCCC